MQDMPDTDERRARMGWFNIIERLIFRDSEHERYDPKEEEKDHTRKYIRRITKELKEHEKNGIAAPYKIVLYAKCDMDRICKTFAKRGYKVTSDGVRTITLH